MGGNHLNFGLVAGPPNVHDCERGRRPGNYGDYCDFIRLAQYFNAIHLIGNQVCAPIELPATSRHLDTYLANLVYSDRVFHRTAIGAGRALDGIRMMAIARNLTLEHGTTPKDFYLKLRLAWARTLLRQTLNTISAVGLECGFGSSSHFSHAYKQVYGIAPSKERRMNAGYSKIL